GYHRFRVDTGPDMGYDHTVTGAIGLADGQQGRKTALRFRLARRVRGGSRWRLRWVVRAATAATVAIGVITGAVHPATAATPASAPPKVGPGGPSAGSNPSPDTPLPFPGTPQPIAPLPTEVVGPLAAQVFNESADTERLGEQLKTLDDQV